MSFNLFARPGTLVFLDDDPDYLEMLALVLPRHWHVRLFMRPTRCVQELQREPPFWEADAWDQQQLVDAWRQGKPLIPQVLAYWARSTERYGMARACIVDYSMPGMNGLEVLQELGDWPGARLLLTGQADEQVAVRAFNEGLIDQYIPKQSPDISKRLVACVNTLLATTHERHAQIWRTTLRPDQHALLRRPAVARGLADVAAENWVEHVVIGEPFGVLGLGAAGEVSWLQLEIADGLADLAELAQLEGVDAAGVAAVRAGRQLADLELRQALGLGGSCGLVDAFRPGGDESLVAALFRLPDTVGPGPDASYKAWLKRQPARIVLD